MTDETVDGTGSESPTGGPEGTEWAVDETSARAAAWCSDSELDQGDTHDKGEQSLCVGEAA